MKKILLLTAAFVFTMSAMAQQTFESLIKLNTEKYDFGKIKHQVPVDAYVELTNISDKPVVVEATRASCGCTTPDKITEPIMPGTTVKLKIQYNAAALAPFTKDLFIKLAGVDGEKVIKIVGEVISADDYDKFVKENAKPKSSSKN